MNYLLRLENLSIAAAEVVQAHRHGRAAREICDLAVTGEPFPALGVQTPPTSS
jgi:hypothetical protein